MVKAVTVNDIDKIAAIEKETFAGKCEGGNGADILNALNSDTWHWLCYEEENGDISAYGAIRIKFGTTAQIKKMACNKAYRRKGRATQVLKALIALAEPNSDIVVTSREHNEAAIKLYQSVGFEIYGKILQGYKNTDGTAEHAFVFKLKNKKI